MRAFVILVAACGGAQRAAPPEDPRLARVDVYGSATMTRDVLIAEHGDRFAQLVAALDAEDRDTALAHRKHIVDALLATGRFAYVEISAIRYFDPDAWYVTLDLVDEADRAARMSFAGKPDGQVPDPDGLLALWNEYEDKMAAVLEAGVAATTCPAFHCLGGFEHPDLAAYGEAFESRVPPAAVGLARVLREDADDVDRASAAYLLAHLDDGARVVEALVPAIRDPSPYVRNSVMRVLALIALDHPDVEIPIEPVIAALRFPATTDRNKAAAILAALSKDEAIRARIVRDAGDVLEAMARLRQPNNSDYAKEILLRSDR